MLQILIGFEIFIDTATSFQIVITGINLDSNELFTNIGTPALALSEFSVFEKARVVFE